MYMLILLVVMSQINQCSPRYHESTQVISYTVTVTAGNEAYSLFTTNHRCHYHPIAKYPYQDSLPS